LDLQSVDQDFGVVSVGDEHRRHVDDSPLLYNVTRYRTLQRHTLRHDTLLARRANTPDHPIQLWAKAGPIERVGCLVKRQTHESWHPSGDVVTASASSCYASDRESD